jgi:hypothetical protein
MIQSEAIKHLLTGFDDTAPVEQELLRYVKHLETDYAPKMEIAPFIFALRCFFAWHRVDGFERNTAAHKLIRDTWFQQNEQTYTAWLAMNQDDTEPLMWAKWTFQAKNSIFDEWLKQNTIKP